MDADKTDVHNINRRIEILAMRVATLESKEPNLMAILFDATLRIAKSWFRSIVSAFEATVGVFRKIKIDDVIVIAGLFLIILGFPMLILWSFIYVLFLM